jgi:hypothetical protein
MKKTRQFLYLAICALFLFSSGFYAQSSLNVTNLGNWGSGEGQNFAVFSLGNLTYYGVGTKLKIADYTDGANPVELSSINLDSAIDEVVRSGNYAYVVAGNQLVVVNTQNPTTPSVAGSIEFENRVRSVATKQNHAFLAGGDDGLIIVDISDPSAPAQVALVDTIGYTQGITVSGNYVYAATGSNLDIFDVTDPTSPQWITNFGVDDWTQNVSVSGSYAYISDYSYGIYVVDVSNPATPTQIGYASTGFRTTKVVFDGNYAFVANGDSMKVLDLSSPADPQIIAGIPMDDRAVNISVGAGKVFVADRNFGLHCIDINDPVSPSVLHQATIVPPASGSAFNTFYRDGNLFVAYGDAGVRVLDASNASAPSFLGEVDTPGDVRGVVVKGGYAYAAARDAGVRILDVSNPASPNEIDSIETPRARGIAINGDYVYVAGSDSGLVVIDVTRPAAPTWVASSSEFYGEGVAVNGNIAAITKWDGIKFFDITNPMSPIPMGETFELTTGTAGLTIDGNYAYVSDFDTLRIFDLSDLNSPALVSSVFKGGEWDGTVVVENDFAYTVSEGEGIKVFNVTDKTNPVEVGHYDGENSSRGIFVNEGVIYVAEKTAGVSIYKNDLVTSVNDKSDLALNSFELLQNYPNPFNPNTKISFTLNKPSKIKLEVTNILGELIATLVDGLYKSGSYEINFNANELSSGIYFYRLSTDGYVSVKKMTLLK